MTLFLKTDRFNLAILAIASFYHNSEKKMNCEENKVTLIFDSDAKTGSYSLINQYINVKGTALDSRFALCCYSPFICEYIQYV